MAHKGRVVALFSGGLDSILAAKLIQEQGLEVTGLHFFSPFFGNPEKIAHWEAVHALSIQAVDISEPFVRMLVGGPAHGFGSALNPCVDCKILMLRRARSIMEENGACCMVSGEVLGQRPMSQRRDALNIIRRDAGVRDCLLRPLSALRLDPIEAELSGRIDRGRLLGISGRGRKEQLALAGRLGLPEIPAPAGGCRLTEREKVRSYWPVLLHAPRPSAPDFQLANTGRQFWSEPDRPGDPAFWLCVGRDHEDNNALMALAREKDLLFKTRDFTGPVALGRCFGQDWNGETVRSAAAFAASYSPRCLRRFAETGTPTAVRVHSASFDSPGQLLTVCPARRTAPGWREYSWAEAQAGIRKPFIDVCVKK